MKMLKLSVIIPCFNRYEALCNTLLSLAEQTITDDIFEVIVVDDGSIDKPIEAASHLTLPYTLCLLKQDNLGPGAARNRGAKHARGDFFIFLDTDMIPSPSLLECYLKLNSQFPNAIIIGRQIPWSEAYSQRTIQIYYSSLAYDLGTTFGRAQFYALASGNFGIDRESFEQLSGFDENLRMSEDVDLGYRASQRGIEILFEPAAIAYHNHPKIPDQIYSQMQSTGWWTGQLLKKHPTITNLIPVYRVLEPIRWKTDPFRLIIRKIFIKLIASRLFLKLLKRLIDMLERISANPRLIRYIRFKVESGHRYIGFQKSLREISST
jgi:GT2 family glycosyltransferase